MQSPTDQLLAQSRHLDNLLASRGINTDSSLPHHRQYFKLLCSRRLTETVFVLLLQSLNLLFDFMLVGHSPIAFGAAVNLILVFWRGYSVVPGLLLGGMAFALYNQAPIEQATAFALANTLQPLLIVYFTRRLLGPLLPFASRKDWFGYVALCCGLSLLVAPLFLFGLGQNYSSVMATQLASRHALGFILLVPANLIWGSYPFIHKLLSKQQWGGIVAGCAALVCGFVAISTVSTELSTAFAVVSFGVFAALGFGIGLYAVAIASLVSSLVLILLALLQQQLSIYLPAPIFLGVLLFALANIGYPLAIGRAQQRKFRV